MQCVWFSNAIWRKILYCRGCHYSEGATSPVSTHMYPITKLQGIQLQCHPRNMHTVPITLSTGLQRPAHGVCGLQGDTCTLMLRMGDVQLRGPSWWAYDYNWSPNVYSVSFRGQWQRRSRLFLHWQWLWLCYCRRYRELHRGWLPMWTSARHRRLHHLLGTLHSRETVTIQCRHRRCHGKWRCALCGEI